LVPGSLTSGRWLQPDDVGKIVVGEEFLRRFQTRLGRHVIVRGTTLHGDVADAAFVIVGAYTTGLAQFDRRTAYITLGDAQRLFDMTGRVTEYVLAGPSPHQSDVLKAAVSAVAAAPERVITTWQEQLPLILKMMELAGGFMWYFYAFFFIAMAFGIANSFLMAVHERRREIGMMLALGVRRRTVVGILFFEALALAIVGSLLGNAMSLALTSYFGTFGLNLTRWAEGMNEFGMSGIVYPYLRLDNLARATLATTITSVLVVLYPARKASRVRPVEALRSV
jgi:ABC-type lipoprotein release transport system permease subunit